MRNEHVGSEEMNSGKRNITNSLGERYSRRQSVGQLYRDAQYRSRRSTSGTGTPRYMLLTIFVQVLTLHPDSSIRRGFACLTDKLTINISVENFTNQSRHAQGNCSLDNGVLSFATRACEPLLKTEHRTRRRKGHP